MVSALNVRPATLQDAPAIAAIYGYYVDHSAVTFEWEAPDATAIAQRMAATMERYPYLVAEQNGIVVGFAYAGAYRPRAAYAWSAETSIYVARDARRSGAGRLLMEALEAALKAMGILNLYACVASKAHEGEDVHLSDDSRRFHEAMGFKVAGELHQCGYKFDRWYSITWMEKSLGPHTPNPTPVNDWENA